jgi:hypothetical protein
VCEYISGIGKRRASHNVEFTCVVPLGTTRPAAMLCSRTGSSSLAVAGTRKQRHAIALRHTAFVRSSAPCVTDSSIRLRLTIPVAAAAPTDEQPSEAADAPADSAAEQPLPSPSTHHMPQITSKERAALRAQSESLAKAKTLQRLQVGAQGLTYNVLVSLRHCHSAICFAPLSVDICQLV